MKVSAGTKTASGRTIDVELTDEDGARIWSSDWKSLDSNAQFRRLGAYADLQVLQYLLRNQEIDRDHFNKRVTELSKDLQ